VVGIDMFGTVAETRHSSRPDDTPPAIGSNPLFAGLAIRNLWWF
jgi:hypothetical protein